VALIHEKHRNIEEKKKQQKQQQSGLPSREQSHIPQKYPKMAF